LPVTEPVSKSTTNLIEAEEEGGAQMAQALVTVWLTVKPPSRVILMGSWAQASSKKETTHAMIKIAVISRTDVFLVIWPPPMTRLLLSTSVAPLENRPKTSHESRHRHDRKITLEFNCQ
jgi:hypothetical protein